MNNIILSFFFTLLHLFIFFYSTLILLLINKLNFCVVLLFLLMLIKYSHYYFKHCILSPLEVNNIYPSLTESLKQILSTFNMYVNRGEEITINFALFLICVKIILLIIIKYYKINIYKLFNIFNNKFL